MTARALVREFHFPEDYPATVELWGALEIGIKVGCSDTLEEIQKKLQRDSDLFLVAEVHGNIVGTIIGGFDGRRGMIYHLAVQAEARKQGIGRMLLQEVENRLKSKGCKKCYLLVTADNINAMKFYEHNDWREMTNDRVFGKEFP